MKAAAGSGQNQAGPGFFCMKSFLKIIPKRAAGYFFKIRTGKKVYHGGVAEPGLRQRFAKPARDFFITP